MLFFLWSGYFPGISSGELLPRPRGDLEFEQSTHSPGLKQRRKIFREKEPDPLNLGFQEDIFPQLQGKSFSSAQRTSPGQTSHTQESAL